MDLTPTQVREWAAHAHGSPLYAHLCEVVAGSEYLMRVINRIENRPPPNILFAAVHFLLLRGEDDLGLARFYRSLVPDPDPPEGVGEQFQRFVTRHEETIVEIGRTRFTQTNECRRCVALLPAIWRAGLGRFHLIDVGTSAGLNLMVDRYRYRWGEREWGGTGSAPLLETEIRGALPEPREIEVLSRTGLDLNPIDVSDPDERLWLDALIWPEHVERRRRLRAALEAREKVDLALVEGSALDTLGPVLDGLPDGEPALVMHSFTLNLFTDEERERFLEVVESASGRRPLARVFFEHLRREDRWQTIGVDTGRGTELIGQGHPHGEWVEFYARP